MPDLAMNKPLMTRLTSKGQTTIPVEVRKALRLEEGDQLLFEVDKGKVTLRRAGTPDNAFLKLSEAAFEEWNSPEDEAAFRDL
jgi:antitoxin PrlF